MNCGGGGAGEPKISFEVRLTMATLEDDIGESELCESFGSRISGPGGKECDLGPRGCGDPMEMAEQEGDDQEGEPVDQGKKSEESLDVHIDEEALEHNVIGEKVIFKKALNTGAISLEICVRRETILNEELTVVHPTEDAIREGLTAGQLRMTIGNMVIVVVKTALDKGNTVSAGRTGDVSVNQGYRFFTSDEIGHVQLHKDHSGSGETVFYLGDTATVAAAGGRIFAARKGCNFVHVANLADVGTRAGRQVLEVPMEVMDLTVGGDMLFILTPTGEIHIRWALGNCQLLAVVPPMAGPLRSMAYRDGKLFVQA